ncbi:MAG TPA: hypothetical protein DIT64_13275 [Verrucomicrobiales bacterium]|nr:hypothetical protein [Verrucomicrobiales bacterium]HCN76019.1 hypothetical protein [Verrucomicrobiales bacterium]HRJ09052.1 hypothetical protein [Prosthecobacter sp.]HRK15603.1 hypothetical protein [Prosthecobacter sp.]
MNPGLDLELPFDDMPPREPVRMDADNYLAFIEFNQGILRENGLVQRVLSLRAEPVAHLFTLAPARLECANQEASL